MRLFATLALAGALAGCTTSEVGTLPTVHAASGSSNVLQFAVGTATIGLNAGGSMIGLNVVTTYRQPDGDSATLQNTPTLTAPAPIFPYNLGGTQLAGTTTTMSGVLPSVVHADATAKGLTNTQLPTGLVQFGTLIGAYGYGLAPLNLVDYTDHTEFFAQSAVAGVGCDGALFEPANGQQFSDGTGYPSASVQRPIQAVPLPLLGGGNCDGSGQHAFGGEVATKFEYLGGPPAWPSAQGYGIPAGFEGYPLGFTDFAVTPPAGAYQLDVAYPTDGTASVYGHADATATLLPTALAAPLPALAPPSLQLPGDGSALVSIAVPPGVTETMVFVEESPCFQNTQAGALGFTPNVWYAAETTGTGQQTLQFSANLGPPDANGNPTHTFCTASDLTASNVNPDTAGYYWISVVGFDYPAYEASYPQSTAQRPTIASGNGTADITVSVVCSGRPEVSPPLTCPAVSDVSPTELRRPRAGRRR
jgi:hypothetical protein